MERSSLSRTISRFQDGLRARRRKIHPFSWTASTGADGCTELSTTSLAALLRDTNRREQARAMLAEVYSWFTEGFDTADLKDANALLDELSN